jgi:TP53 regulating kinase-like protein
MDISLMELISQGAEGKVYKTMFQDRLVIVKERLHKRYRAQELDRKLTRQRLLQEARCMVKCRKAGVRTPSIYMINNNFMYIELINGDTLKQLLYNSKKSSNAYPIDSVIWAKQIGIAIALMHDIDVIHGDLTTSNIMINTINSDNNQVKYETVLIDFGLGMMQANAEDKAVDLYVLERAFISTHPGSENIVALIIEEYSKAAKKGTAVLQKLDAVRLRGRKRECFG